MIQPQRELPLLHKTDVLVVGGGPAGVAAAIAAKRSGADVTLVERYGHFGGLWTGGLVLLVTGHIVKGGKQVCQGIGEESCGAWTSSTAGSSIAGRGWTPPSTPRPPSTS